MKKSLTAMLLSAAAMATLAQAQEINEPLNAMNAVEQAVACGKHSDYAWLNAALNASTGQVSEIKSVKPAGELDLCEIRLDSGTVVYSRPGTQAILLGRLFSVTGTAITDKTQASIDQANLELLSDIKASDYIAYAPTEPAKSHIYVMTDVECTYCQKLHTEVSKLNAAGIEVRYLPFVRGGRQGSAWNTMSNIWCSTGDRKKSLNEAIAGKKLEKAECGEEVLDRYQVFGRDVQLQGTPHILFANGTSQSGSSNDLITKALNASNNGASDAPTH